MNTKRLPLADVLGHEASDKRIDILRRIAQVGSISEAARGAGVSYKAGWQALETLANLAGTPLVEKVVGGSGGGGALLTDAGQKVLLAAEAMAKARRQVLQLIDSGDLATGRAAFALRTSMRNQFPCTVGVIKPHMGQVRVQLLGLRKGLDVLALCKATAVHIDSSEGDVDGKNTLTGVVTRATRSAKGGEVSVRLPAGVQLVGFASAISPKVGQSASAQIDEAGIVIAALN